MSGYDNVAGLVAVGQTDPKVLWIGLILMLVAFYAYMLSSNRKERRKRRDMLAAIKKNDRVMTIGGLIGTVVTVKENEVVLKIDETTNTKVSFVRSAVQKVLQEDEVPSIDQ